MGFIRLIGFIGFRAGIDCYNRKRTSRLRRILCATYLQKLYKEDTRNPVKTISLKPKA